MCTNISGNWENYQPLTPKLLGHFSQSIILFPNVVHQKYNICMKLVQNNEYLVSTVDTDGLVVQQI